MTLVFRIFEPNKKQTKTLSEKLSDYSLKIFIGYGLFYLIIEKFINVRIPDALNLTCVLLVLVLHLISKIKSITEFESINGTFNGSFKFGDAAIECENTYYFYKDMDDFNIRIVDFYGANTNNRYGPAYKNGTSNYLSFITDGKEEKFYFEIKTEYFITAIYYHLIDIICNEKLPFQEKYLNLIPKKHKEFVVYREFVSKLRSENRIAN